MQLDLSFSLVFIFGIFQCHGTGHSYGAFFVKSLLFVHKLSNFIVLTKHSQTPASLFLAWCFDLYPKVFLKGYERRSKVQQLCTTSQLFWVCPRLCRNVRPKTNLLVSVSALSEFSPSVMPFNFIVVVHRIAMYWTWWVMARNISSTRIKQFLPLFHSCLDICTQQKTVLKKLLYKSVGINSAVFKVLDKSSGVTGAHGSHFLME